MRCPKCQYIGFDSGHRCRNCGYEFSLAVEDNLPVDVPIGRDDPGRMADLALTVPNEPLAPGALEDVADRHGIASRAHAGLDRDLPLFTSRVVDDQAPLVTPPTVPRPPLSVRRAGPPRPRARTTPAEPSLDLRPVDTRPDVRQPGGEYDQLSDAASVPQRLVAGLIDVSLLFAIAAAVVSLTLQVARLPAADWRLLPAAPLGAFLLLLCGGYFTLFTAAGGQTIGKMLARIRVVAPPGERPYARSVPFGTALVRAVVCGCSVGALGAGFLPVLFRADRRAFHDRIADTRVVSA